MRFDCLTIIKYKPTAFVAQRLGARNNESGSERIANRFHAEALAQFDSCE